MTDKKKEDKKRGSSDADEAQVTDEGGNVENQPSTGPAETGGGSAGEGTVTDGDGAAGGTSGN